MLMTYAKAIKIQKEQFRYYTRNMINNKGKKILALRLREETKTCPTGDAPTPIQIRVINELVPRGCWFEEQRNMAVIFKYSKEKWARKHGRKWYAENRPLPASVKGAIDLAKTIQNTFNR